MKQPAFRTARQALVILMFVMMVFGSGCVYLVVGSVGALGGYVVSPDTVQGTIERDFGETWEASMTVLNIMGRVVKQNERDGKAEVIVNNARVNITLTQFSQTMVRINVRARKSFFPSIATAQDVYSKIINELTK